MIVKRDEAAGGETVEALEARQPFRFPREMVIGLLALAVLWEMVSMLVPPFVVPGWGRIFRSLAGLRLDFVLITLARVVAALVISFVLGLGLAVVMYASAPFERYGRPIVRLFMAVPVVCWILFAVLWFKWVEFRIAFVLVVVCAPVFLVDVLDGMKGVSKDLRDMLRSFRPSRTHFFTKLVLPATLPAILTSWKINLSLAIRRLDFVIRQGDMVAIVGQTGCGKSTFLNLLIGLDRPSGGRIAIGGRTPYDDFDHFRGVLAAVFQQDRLLPWRTAIDNVRLPLELLGQQPSDQVERARAWLDRLGVARFEPADPHELAGGKRPRGAPGRALVLRPPLPP